MHSISFLLRVAEPEWKIAPKRPRYYVSLETQDSVRCKCAAIHCKRWISSSILEWYLRVTEGGARRLMHGLVRLTQFCVTFIALLSQNGSFQTPQSCGFLNRSLFRSIPMVMNLGLWMKKYCLKCKRQKWDFCEEYTMWHFATKCAAVKIAEPWMSTTSPNREIPATLVRPCVQNGPRKTSEASPAG